ncbi:hypothetical protein C0J52_04961, partial [Blattella germanica]
HLRPGGLPHVLLLGLPEPEHQQPRLLHLPADPGLRAARGRKACGSVSSAGNSLYRRSSSSKTTTTSSCPRRRKDASKIHTTIRTAEIIIMLVALFLVSWTPYAVVTCIGQFGDQRLVTPWVASLPAFFAKASVVYNPIVYGLSHPHFRASVKQYMSTCRCGGGSTQTQTPNLTSRSKPVHPPPTPTLMPHHHRRASSSVVHHHHHIHHVHFRCFPHHRHPAAHAHFHSDPDPRAGVTLILDEPESLQWQEGDCNEKAHAVVCVQGSAIACCAEKPSRTPL